MKKYLLLLGFLFLAFITNSCDKEEGPTEPIPWGCGGTVEYEGKTYRTVQIGNQCWFRQNLDVGVMINGFDTAKDNGNIEKYCIYNDTANCKKYGALYLWDEAMQYTNAPGAKGICPTGWHIPTEAEFETLSVAVGWDGNALKAIGEGKGWGAGTNKSGFSALMAGERWFLGAFSGLSEYAKFWTSTEYQSKDAWHFSLDAYAPFMDITQSHGKDWGFSIRCLKD